MLPLDALGPRIVILGPSNAGKSTLAVAIAKKTGLEAIHLDQLRHLPNTDWVVRSDAEFEKLHVAAIRETNWVMDGNYSSLLPQRLERATGAIHVTSNSWFRFWRYLKRTLFKRSLRHGGLEGAQDSIKLSMVDWILVKTRKSSEKYSIIIRQTGIPAVECRTRKELNKLYEEWGLKL